MVANAILIFCSQALLAKFALSQCCGRGMLGSPYAMNVEPVACRRFGWGEFLSLESADGGLNPLFSGSLMVTSFSPVSPTGLRVTSKNTIEGVLAVIGNLPFLGAVTTDGAFASTGAGAVSYGCGDGCIGINEEMINVPASKGPPIVPRLGFGAGVSPFALPHGREYSFGYKYRCGCNAY